MTKDIQLYSKSGLRNLFEKSKCSNEISAHGDDHGLNTKVIDDYRSTKSQAEKTHLALERNGNTCKGSHSGASIREDGKETFQKLDESIEMDDCMYLCG